MTGTSRSSDGLDTRRRRVLFRSWHRGIREMDLVLGRFADEQIGTLSDEELSVYEALMEVPDRDLLKWVTGEVDVPANYDTPVFRRVKAFNMRVEDYLPEEGRHA